MKIQKNMQEKKLLLTSLFTIVLILVFHYLSLKYSWYWTYRWLDIPVHIIGGFWISLMALWVCLKIKHIDSILDYRKRAFIVMLFSVLVVATLWEIFELLFSVTSIDLVGYWFDSIGDIVSGLFGGLVAFLFFIKNRKTENVVLQKTFTKDFIIIL